MAHDTWTRAILYNLSYVITERKKERLGMIFNMMYINEYDNFNLFNGYNVIFEKYELLFLLFNGTKIPSPV